MRPCSSCRRFHPAGADQAIQSFRRTVEARVGSVYVSRLGDGSPPVLPEFPLFTCPCCLSRKNAGSASGTLLFSRPHLRSLSLRPDDSLSHLSWPLSAGYTGSVSLPRAAQATRLRLLPGWITSHRAHLSSGRTFFPRWTSPVRTQSPAPTALNPGTGRCKSCAPHEDRATLRLWKQECPLFPGSAPSYFFCRGRGGGVRGAGLGGGFW
jgi:hypothetical protein